jgi:hypothetical protein
MSGADPMARLRQACFEISTETYTTTNHGAQPMTVCLRKDDLEWREIDGEIVALDGKGAVYLSVSGSGAMLWRLLADGAERDRLADALVDHYGIDADRAGDDLDSFLSTLGERGLLVT